MKLSTTKRTTQPKRWLWFVGLYSLSLLVMGVVYFLIHLLIKLLA